jgi:two-component system, NarL family, nitrate/nitrite response regulator NarL
MLRVLVVSDVRLVRQGLQAVLAECEELDVVSTADTLRAGDQSTRLNPDVVLFDAARRESAEVVRDLVTAAPHCKVVAFGVREAADEEILALAAAGTAGYVRASAEGSDVVRVLLRVMSDELPCSARTAASLYRRVATLSQPRNDPPDSAGCVFGAASLSRRELQIAHLIGCGLSNKQIARKLGICAATVKNHVHNMYEKLKVHRRGEAAARIRALLGAGTPLITPFPVPAADLARGKS